MARAELYFRYLRGLNHHPAISKIESLALIDSSALLALFKKKLILREATELSEWGEVSLRLDELPGRKVVWKFGYPTVTQQKENAPALTSSSPFNHAGLFTFGW